MPIQNFCFATQDHGDIQPRLLLGATFRSMVLGQLDSELITLASVATKGYAESRSLGQYLKPCWF